MKYRFTFRTRFKKDIVTEFLPPSRSSDKVIILCGGMPSMPSVRLVMDFWAAKGYWVFFPRYRGSWESGGQFMKISPHRDVLDVIDELPKGFKSAWDGTTYRVKPKSIFLLASSFGGAAALLASQDKRVDKVIAFSPVVDWRAASRAEPVERTVQFTKEAFGQAYRGPASVWKKIKSGKFYNPIAVADKLDGSRMFIIHAQDDESVSATSVKKFARLTGAPLVMLKKGGHFSLSASMKPSFYKKIKKFLSVVQ